MATEMQRSEYPAMLASIQILRASLQPLNASRLLNQRLRTVGKANSDIADWLQERRRIDEQYALSLRKLAKEEPPDSESELGIFTSPWNKIISATNTLADSHQNFARRIEMDVEKPLREFTTHNRQIQNLSTMQGNLTALAREYDSAQKKTEKLNQRGGRAAASKVAGASEEIDTALAQWDSQAPYVFEQLQAVDESRLNHLRDVLTQFHTHEVDQVERHRVAAEQCLNALLNVNTADEIQAFTARNSGPTARTSSRIDWDRVDTTTTRRERRQSRAMDPPSHNNLLPTTSTSLQPPNGEDQATRRSPSPRAQSPQDEKKKPSGLRRLGTVFNKRRQSVMPAFSRPGGGRTKSATRLGSSTDLADETIPEMPSNNAQRGTSPPEETFEPPAGPPPRSNDVATDEQQDRLEPVRSYSQTEHPVRSSSTHAHINRAHQETLAQLQQPMQPVASSTHQQSAQEAPRSERDADGYSTRAPMNDPITQAQQEAAGFEGSEAANAPIKLDIRNAPIAEEAASADQALASVASTLRAQAVPTRRAGTLRGRRDVRNTVFVPSDTASQFDTTNTTPAQLSSFAPSGTSTMIPEDSTPNPSLATLPQQHRIPLGNRQISHADDASDAQSTRSGHSLVSTTTAQQHHKHPDSRAAGLSHSIIETVSATLSHGAVTHCAVQGELALTQNPDLAASTSASGGRGRATIRLDNFPILEKVAPNPSFVNQLNPGEYAVDLGALQASAGGRPAVAFKYKLHVDTVDATSMTRHCPLLLTPSWKHETNQSSVILSYALNHVYGQGEDVVLSNVVLALHLEGARATSCQSKPAGTFSKRENLIYWRFEELRLGNAGAQKVIARFATDGGVASGGRCETRWEVVGSGRTSRDDLGVSRLDGVGAGVASGGGADPFADEDGAAGARGRWVEVKGVRRAVAGTYVAT